MEGQLPRAGLMVPSMCHGREVTIGTGGGCAVISASRTILHFYQDGHGLFHSISLLHWCSALLNYPALCTLLFSFIWPPGSFMPREQGKPKRGPSWYCYVARQRHLHELAWASSTTLIQRNKESEDASNGLCGGGNPRGTNYGSTRLPPLHGPRPP
jgi:hypothetical protein